MGVRHPPEWTRGVGGGVFGSSWVDLGFRVQENRARIRIQSKLPLGLGLMATPKFGPKFGAKSRSMRLPMLMSFQTSSFFHAREKGPCHHRVGVLCFHPCARPWTDSGPDVAVHFRTSQKDGNPRRQFPSYQCRSCGCKAKSDAAT